jgi:hypothetical protein
MGDEKSKQQAESKQYSFTPSLATSSPPNSVFATAVSRPGTSQIMSPGHSIPTGLANLDKSETIPEIQMPSMASFDPNFFPLKEVSSYSSILC